MRKAILGVALGGTLALSSLGMAFAASPNQAAPGTPGDKNCVGQTTSFLAQLGAGADITGIGNLAAALGASVKDLKAIVAAYCAGP